MKTPALIATMNGPHKEDARPECGFEISLPPIKTDAASRDCSTKIDGKVREVVRVVCAGPAPATLSAARAADISALIRQDGEPPRRTDLIGRRTSLYRIMS